MIRNRELTIDDYLTILRRRWKVIAFPVVLAPLAGFLISYAIPARYISQSLVLVEGQKVAEGYVRPLVKEDVAERVPSLEQQVLSRARLQSLIQRLAIHVTHNMDDTIDQIQKNLSIEPLSPSEVSLSKKSSNGKEDVPGFYVNFTASDPQEAERLCSEITSMLLEENSRAREQVAQGTTDFLSVQLQEAKRNLDELDAKLSAFKQQHIGQLPEDQEQNMQILSGLNSQLDANTQSANRAQQDRAYTESLLAQQRASWKQQQNATDPQTLEQQLAQLQSQLLILQARYTDDHPDVIKAKSDIAEVKDKLDAMNAAAGVGKTGASEKPSGNEPPEIQQLRLQIQRFDDTIAQATREQARLQNQIRVYQNRIALSPVVEEEYKVMARDYETGQKLYDDLLAKKNEAQMQGDLERSQEGEQMTLLNPASLPDEPSFPNRLLFTAVGLGAGFVFGMSVAAWLELRDNSIRSQEDLAALLNPALLVSVPWVGQNDTKNVKKLDQMASLGEPLQAAKP